MVQLIRSALLALVLALPVTAAAADWTWQDAPVQPGFDLDTTGLPSGGMTDAWEAALKAAIRTWNVQGDASVVLAYDGRSTTPGDGARGDGRNTVDAGTGTGTDPLVVSLATSNDELTECDVRLLTSNDGGAVTWSTAAEGAPSGSYDAERALLYALGHCLGLSDGTGDSALAPPTPGTGPDARVLSSDDVSALQAIYGPPVDDLQEYTLQVLYDVGDTGGDGRGAPGEQVVFKAQLLDQGDPIYDGVGTISTDTSTAQITWVDDTVDVGDIGRGQTGNFLFTFRIDDCDPNSNPTAVLLDVTDARGDVHEVSIDFALQCAAPHPQDTGEPAKTCGCATSDPRAGLGGVLLVLGLLALRRREGRGLLA